MCLTKQHFQTLAQAFHDVHASADVSEGDAETVYLFLQNRIADFCADMNPAFDRVRFLDWCANGDPHA